MSISTNDKPLDLIDLCDKGLKIYPLKFNEYLHTAYNLGNMSMLKLENGNYLLSIRQFNYFFSSSFGKSDIFFYKNFISDRDYYFVEVDRNFKFIKQWSIDIDYTLLTHLEDIRLTYIDNTTIQISATLVGYFKVPTMCYFTVNIDLYNNKLVQNKSKINIIDASVTEKNWIPIVGKSGCFISSIKDNSIMLVENFKSIYLTCSNAKKLRGSSQLINYNNNLVTICHSLQQIPISNDYKWIKNNNQFHQYRFYLVKIAPNYSSCVISKPFVFLGSYVSFLCGILIDDDIIHMPITLNDSDTYMVSINVKVFEDFCMD